MTTEEIIEGNKLIAQFVGRDKAFDPRDKIYHYHSSWDWLMPVVEKIELLNWNVNINNDCCIYDYQHKITANGKSITNIGNTKIESVWLSVVDFIKWYNNQNK